MSEATSSPTPEWILVFCLIAVTVQLIRLSIDLVQRVSLASSIDEKKSDDANAAVSTISSIMAATGKAQSTSAPLKNGATNAPNYGSVVEDDEEQTLLSKKDSSSIVSSWLSVTQRNLAFFTAWTVLCILFLIPWIVKAASIFPNSLLLSTAGTLIFEIHLLFSDWKRQRYGIVQRFFHVTTALTLWCVFALLWMKERPSSYLDGGLLAAATLNVILTVAEGWATSHYVAPSPSKMELSSKKKRLSMSAIYTLVKPYVWPDATDTSAFKNRLRAIGTWVCVIVSKVCGLISPLYLGWASTALAHQDYKGCIRYSVMYCVVSWLGSTFREGQSLIYLKVAQAAFVQLSETAFGHLHCLSLDWHLRKKLGEVLRSMDRGIAACDTLMKYLFLWLVPAIAECLVVCIIFATYFKYLPLAVTVFYFVFAYIVWTIVVTVWRKKFRKALVKHDNEWHDLFTDSLINFETVKFFTAEHYEMGRFADAVSRFQARSVDVQGSLSFLNISQQIMLKTCLALALSLAALGIQKRIDCCVHTIGCDSGISECCQNVSQQICPGMQVGDFVAVLTYTLQLFAPLNFLGSVYNAIVMAVIDLGTMSELLAESPDLVDAPDAMELPLDNTVDPDVAIEFDNVFFHYPTQPKDRGLKGLSFKMKRGTTTAIVGPTGAGKTTVSRLLFRFYDVLGGAVKFNGIDVRSLTQQSLRGAIGVVPQTASMFNDTIRSNILYGRRDATEEELLQAARDAQILGFIESLDLGWETMVGDRGLKLSGGEKQRTAIARCLLKDPPFVLLDEATSALDTLTENSVQEALDRLGAERTVLVIAHRLGTIRNADNIVVLKDGRAFEEGTHDELLARNGVYAEMWNMQLHSTSTSASQANLIEIM